MRTGRPSSVMRSRGSHFAPNAGTSPLTCKRPSRIQRSTARASRCRRPHSTFLDAISAPRKPLVGA
jgi:hypothetical protein